VIASLIYLAYEIRSQSRLNQLSSGKASEELLNLNHDHEFSYTREQSIAMMDEEWAILKGEKERDWGGD
jgi:hypothetical protein